ncbi:MAG: glycosyltransferase [Blastocatellia bacterium]
MRVSIIGPAYPLRGGIAHHVYWLWRELRDRGHTVQVVSFRKLYPRILFPGATQLDSSLLKLDPKALPILTPLNPISWLRALSRVKAFSPDIVVFEWWNPFFAPIAGTLSRLLRRSGVKRIFECHNVFPHEGGPLDRLLLRFAFSSADHFITHSTKDRDDLSALVPGKEITVSPLPSLEEFSSADAGSRDGRTILFFGKVRKYKGLEVLLAAMPLVLSKIDCRLVIVGEFYDSVAKYQRLIRERGLEDSVHIDNRYVPNEEVPAIFEDADVLVLPYLSATQSGVARIALSSGLPVIASRTGGLCEAVIEGFNGLLFSPGDPAALAEQLVMYFSDNLGTVFGKNIRTAASTSQCSIVETIEQMAQHQFAG